MHTTTYTPTPAEILKELELDWMQFIDKETACELGATYDKPLRERLRILMQSFSSMETILHAELTDQITGLNHDIADMERTIGIMETRNLELEDENEELTKELEKFKAA